MKLVMTPIFCADPWLKLALLAGSKLFSLRPSKPGPKTMVGFEQLPRLIAGFTTTGVVGVEEEAGAGQFAAEVGAGVGTGAGAGAGAGAAAPPAAAAISAAVASLTRRFWVKMHPVGSLATSPEHSQHIMYVEIIWRIRLTSIPLSAVVGKTAGRKGTALESILRISTDAGNLLS